MTYKPKILEVTDGGTGASNTATSGKVLIGNGTNFITSTPGYPNTSATSGKFLISDGTNFIASTPTIPNTAGTSGKVLVSDGTNYVSSTPTFPNASATTRKIIVSDGTNWVASTETYAVPGTTGNILTSDGTNWTSAAPAAGGLTWNEETTTSVTAVVNNGYITNNAGAVTVSLPAVFAVGATVAVVGKGAGGWIIDAPAGDTIRMGSSASSSGGTFTSTNQFDCVELVGTVANDTWTARSSIGNITIA